MDKRIYSGHSSGFIPTYSVSEIQYTTSITAVVGQLSWKNYGNSHTIFDASASTSPEGGAVNNTNSQVVWSSTYPTLMGWNGANTYGVRVDSARIADTVTNGFYTTSSFNLGTTSIAVNRSSATQSLTGINIDGSSGSCTGNAATATTATNQSGGTVSATTGTFSDTVTLTTKPFFRNVPTIAANYTVTTTYNEMSIGPITINSGITVTVNSGATWTVV
jgi:hypothetical protein